MIRNYVKPPKVRRFTSVEQIDLLNGAMAGDVKSRNILWSIAVGIMMSHLKRSGVARCNYDDIIQEWAIAFFSSLGDFDPTRGKAPASFFYRRAPHTIRDYMRKHSVAVAVPRENKNKPEANAFPEFISHGEIDLAYIGGSDA